MAPEPAREAILDAVRDHYAAAARQVQRDSAAGCCTGGRRCSERATELHMVSDLAEVPNEAALASLGCGNPALLARLQPGEVVLDLGSGGGLDVLLAAKGVGPTGRAYGLDMTDEMLALARVNAAKAGLANVEFLKGFVESIPLPDASVDVIISNCVINLSPDKDAVLREACRVLRPGGRFAVADVVVQGQPLAAPLRRMLSLWAGCVAGALTEADYRAKLATAGFGEIEVQVIRDYTWEDLPSDLQGVVALESLAGPASRLVSAFVRAVKPASQAT